MKLLITFLMAFALLLNIFTPLQLFLGGGQTISNMIVIVLIVLYDKLFARRSFWVVTVYAAVCLSMQLAGYEYFENSIPQILLVMLSYCVWEHFLLTRDTRYGYIVLSTTYMALLFLILLSIPQFYFNPNMTRMLNAAKESGQDLSLFYWIINYQTVHALPIYAIPLFIVFKIATAIKYKIIFGLALLSVLVVMVFADATTPLILLFLITIVLFIYNSNYSFKKNVYRISGFGLLALLFLNKLVLISFLHAVQPIFEGSSTYKKIDEICLTLSGEDTSGDMEIREDMLNTTLTSIFDNPFLPESDIQHIGHHNFLLDMMAALGLLLFIPVLLLLKDRYKAGKKCLSDKMYPYFLIGFFSMLFMAITKNYFLAVPMFGILPLFLCMIDIVMNNNKQKL